MTFRWLGLGLCDVRGSENSGFRTPDSLRVVKVEDLERLSVRKHDVPANTSYDISAPQLACVHQSQIRTLTAIVIHDK